MFKPIASVLADYYKISHRPMYPKGTSLVYATWTPRTSRVLGVDEVVVFGHQAFVMEWLIGYFNENFFSRPKADVVAEYARVIKYTLGDPNPDSSHIAALHDLGYLPLLIRAVPEGTVVPLRTPTLTIQNTHEDFFWLTNYIETLASCELWPAYTSATTAREYRRVLDAAAARTGGDPAFVQFQGHDFSMRGMMGLRAASLSGMGHLLSFSGTDTIPAILAAEHYYGANIEKELVGTSIPASEHSIECTYPDDMEYFDKLITKVHSNGFVSIVADGRDFWDVIANVIPALKEKILVRKGGPLGDRVVIRPDSGDPVAIVCGDPLGKTELEKKGAIEALWDIFGGTVNEKGFKVLDPHIGLIYGDAITLRRAEEIVKRLEAKGFVSTSAVFGIGSYTYQYVTRDTYGFALKTTVAVVDGVEKQIFKDPKTDDGVKKSQRGAVHVWREADGAVKWSDGHSLADRFDDELMIPIFGDGELLVEEKFDWIRKRLAASNKAPVAA